MTHFNHPIYAFLFFGLVIGLSLFFSSLGMGFDGIVVAVLLAAAAIVFLPRGVAALRRQLTNSVAGKPSVLEFLLTPGGTYAVPPQLRAGSSPQRLPAAVVEASTLPLEAPVQQVTAPFISVECLHLASTLHPHADEILSGRLSIFGVSGSGKSNTVAVLCEELARLGVPFLLADTEDEYSPLCQAPFLPRGYLAGSRAARARVSLPSYLAVNEAGAFAFGQALLAQGLQVILNLESYETDDEAAGVLVGIIAGMRAWEEERRSEERVSCMFILEEAAVWLPQNPRESTLSKERLAGLQQAFFATVVRRGRKRGIGFTFATQRIAEIDKRAMSSSWTILHRQTQDVDLKRYEEFGIDRDQAMALADGEAFVFSPNAQNVLHQFRLRHSPHGAKTPGLASVRRHHQMLQQVPVALDPNTFVSATPQETMQHLTFPATQQETRSLSSEAGECISVPPDTAQGSELERALHAWQSGHQSVRKLQKALGISQYQAYEWYRQLKERRLI